MKILRKIIDFFIIYYDKILLATLLSTLSVVLIFQTRSLDNTREKVVKANEVALISSHILKPIDEQTLQISIQTDLGRTWKERYGDGSLLGPGSFVYSSDGVPYLLYIDTITSPFTGRRDVSMNRNLGGKDTLSLDTDKDGIPDQIEQQYGLDKNDVKDSSYDNDSDGFTNLEEYLYKTGISDSKSHPNLIYKVRLLKKSKTPLAIMLKKVIVNDPNDKESWDIMLNYKSNDRWKSAFLKIGDTIPKFNYIITDAQYEEIIKNKIPVEQSKITIKEKNRPPITLLRNRASYGGDEFYELLYLLKKKPIKITVSLLKEFSLESTQREKEIYKLIKDDEKGLIAQLVKSGKEFKIAKFSSVKAEQ